MEVTFCSQEIILQAEQSLHFWNTTTVNYSSEGKQTGPSLITKTQEFSSNSGWYLFPITGSIKLIAADEEKVISAYEDTENWVSYIDLIYDKPVRIQATEDTRFILYKRAYALNTPISQIKVTKVSANSVINFNAETESFYVISNSTHSVIGATTSQKAPDADVRPDPSARFLVYPYKSNSVGGQITITTADPILVAQF